MTAGAEAPVSGDCNAGLKGQLYRAGRVQGRHPELSRNLKLGFFMAGMSRLNLGHTQRPT